VILPPLVFPAQAYFVPPSAAKKKITSFKHSIQVYKKRFSISDYNGDNGDECRQFESRRFEERENKIPRTVFKEKSTFLRSMECDDADADAMNLSTSGRRATNSLMDLVSVS
jgi:hypothetical protein